MPTCFFATDLHGSSDRYEKLFSLVAAERPAAVFLGGDLLPRSCWTCDEATSFIGTVIVEGLENLKGVRVPDIFLILGNDDPRCAEPPFEILAARSMWNYVHGRHISWNEYTVYGYACVPPTPFLLKDWERYDISRYVAPGCVSPEAGRRTVPVEPHVTRWGTMKKDLENLAADNDLSNAIWLFHAPPADSSLDLAELDGKTYEHVPLDPHVGSIAVTQFIEERQPLITLHGHVHESARLSGEWKVQIGRTVCINGAHDGPELALIRFDPSAPNEATRQLI